MQDIMESAKSHQVMIDLRQGSVLCRLDQRAALNQKLILRHDSRVQ